MTILTLNRAADQVYDALRDLIVAGEFDPDQKIEEIPVSERLGVSRTPVREALMRLECVTNHSLLR